MTFKEKKFRHTLLHVRNTFCMAMGSVIAKTRLADSTRQWV